jgi:hypothetical protein
MLGQLWRVALGAWSVDGGVVGCVVGGVVESLV